MDKALRNAIIAGIIIIALSVGYYLVIFLPNKEAMRLEQQRQDKENEEKARKNCYDEAIAKARDLFKTKAELGDDEDLKRGVERNLYLKDDFGRYYEECLSVRGLKK